MADYSSLRQRLDTVLRTLDVKQLQDFLIAEGQWRPDQPADTEFAGWWRHNVNLFTQLV